MNYIKRLLPILVLVLFLAGCGGTDTKSANGTTDTTTENDGITESNDVSDSNVASDSHAASDSNAASDGNAASEGSAASDGSAASEGSSGKSVDKSAEFKSSDAKITEDGTYDSKDEVALYIHEYNKLPSNYITKAEARKLGWEGGSVEEYAPGKCIGGDYFGNYEGLLPEEDDYHECDIDTLGEDSRGAKRIIYSDDGDIYYTEDHYESFEQVY